jgi:RecB family endonuclease NucS
MENALQAIQKFHVEKPEKTTVMIIGDCMVDYRGRAQSFLDWGQRTILLKQDGNLLVHQPIMREPVNWQPSGSSTTFILNKKNQLELRSKHAKPAEKMTITFRSIDTVLIRKLVDKASLIIAGMETDVVNQIMKDPNIIEEGLRVAKREKTVKSGLIDLYCYDKNHVPTIIEVKRSIGNISAVQQLRMYVNDIKGDVEDAPVRGILCAPRIPDMAKHLLSDYGLEWREIERKIMLPDDSQTSLHEF